jgi:hypothetical protein
MIVLRIAHPAGHNPSTGLPVGPYNGLREATWTEGERAAVPLLRGPGDQPTPCCADEPGDILYQEVCGFATAAQLLSWFSYSLDQLAEHGWHVFAYEVPDDHVRQGRCQVVFAAHAAAEVDRKPCSDYAKTTRTTARAV